MPQLTFPSEDLVNKLRINLSAIAKGGFYDDLAKAIAVAFVIIEHFLGKDFSDRYIAPSNNPNPYMMNGFDTDPGSRFLYQDRVIRFADYLYRLQGEQGFDILLERFTSNRDMRSVNLEAMVANYFKKHQFDVEILRLTGVKGRDFDFTAMRNVDVFNVEVTGCTNDKFSARNLTNVLNSKRKQLPSTGPALLYCILPQEWLSHYPDLNFGLFHVTCNFYEISKRINAVIYVMSQIRRIGSGAAFFDVFAPITNPNARFKPDLSFLFQDKPELRALQRELLANSDKNFPAKLDSLSYWPLIAELTSEHRS